jgi:hypothetical protein
MSRYLEPDPIWEKIEFTAPIYIEGDDMERMQEAEIKFDLGRNEDNEFYIENLDVKCPYQFLRDDVIDEIRAFLTDNYHLNRNSYLQIEWL